MNRLRNAYLDVAPGLEPWFSLGHHDDIPGILLSYGPQRRIGGAGRILSAIATTVAVINCLLIGVIAALGTRLLGGTMTLALVLGIVGVLGSGIYALVLLPMRQIRKGLSLLEPRFPTPDADVARVREQTFQQDD